MHMWGGVAMAKLVSLLDGTADELKHVLDDLDEWAASRPKDNDDDRFLADVMRHTIGRDDDFIRRYFGYIPTPLPPEQRYVPRDRRE